MPRCPDFGEVGIVRKTEQIIGQVRVGGRGADRAIGNRAQKDKCVKQSQRKTGIQPFPIGLSLFLIQPKGKIDEGNGNDKKKNEK